MIDTVEFTLAAALTNTGTVTVSYPTGRSKGNYAGFGINHVLIAGQNKYTAPKDFTLTFNANASNITLTSGISTTLAAGTKCYLSIERRGEDDFAPVKPASAIRMVSGSMWAIDLGSPNAADSDGVCASQSVTSSATLDGALVSGGVATFDVPRNVVAAWTTSAVITVTGTDEHGNTLVEQSASGTSLTGKKAFKTVTAVSFSTAVTGATVGTGDVLGLPVFLPSVANVLMELKDGVAVSPPRRIYIPWEIEATELAAGTAEQLVAPCPGYIAGIRAICQEAINTGGDITVKIGTTDVTGLTISPASSDTAGTRYSDTPTTARSSTTVLAAGDRIQIVPAAAFATAGAVNGVLEIETDGVVGTLVAGSTSAASATSGDVRGTYDPVDACDGATAYMLLVSLTDPSSKGIAQYAG